MPIGRMMLARGSVTPLMLSKLASRKSSVLEGRKRSEVEHDADNKQVSPPGALMRGGEQPRRGDLRDRQNDKARVPPAIKESARRRSAAIAALPPNPRSRNRARPRAAGTPARRIEFETACSDPAPCFGDRPEAVKPASIATVGEGDGLDAIAFGIAHEGGVIAGGVFRPRPRRTVGDAAGLQGRGVERVDRLGVRARAARQCAPIAASTAIMARRSFSQNSGYFLPKPMVRRSHDHPAIAERREHGVIELAAAGEDRAPQWKRGRSSTAAAVGRRRWRPRRGSCARHWPRPPPASQAAHGRDGE